MTACVPDALGRINENQESAFGSIKRTQTNISFQSSQLVSAQLILKELKSIRSREEAD